MKALTLMQPWASLVATGAKRLETRSWQTRYRGKLAIHAAKAFPTNARQLCRQEPFRTVLAQAGISGPEQLPTGAVLATCELVTIVRGGRPAALAVAALLPVSPHELWFGDFSPGRYAWVLDEVQALLEPIPARGALGLWQWTGGAA
jgi:activating signal cointegrator 1